MDYLAALNPFQLLSLGSKKVVLNKEDCDSNQKKALEELLALFDDKITPGEALGYLKFRNWKVAEAAAQLRSTLCWRQSGCNRVCISDVARFMRGPPDGCIVCLEDMKGGCARDLLGRPVIASIGMLHGSLQDMRAQMIYAMERAKLYQQSSNSVHSSSVVIEVVPRTGASATFRFPDSNTKLLMETQRQHYPGTLTSTTHFCGIPSAITWAFALCKPFMDAESYNNMVLRPDHSHLSPTYISKENLLKEWGGTFAFTLEEYLKWRAEEEGVTLDESDVQRYDASAAEKISSDDMLEALVAISVVEHKLSGKPALLCSALLHPSYDTNSSSLSPIPSISRSDQGRYPSKTR